MSDPVWPSFTFTVDLSIVAALHGPNTNQSSVNALHPDQHQDSADNGRVEESVRRDSLSTWIPNLLHAGNRNLKHGDSFTVTGLKAMHMRDTYGIGFAPADRAVLTVVANASPA